MVQLFVGEQAHVLRHVAHGTVLGGGLLGDLGGFVVADGAVEGGGDRGVQLQQRAAALADAGRGTLVRVVGIVMRQENRAGCGAAASFCFDRMRHGVGTLAA